MKIFAISDTHGNLEGLDPSGSDVVVMAGDLAPLRGWNVSGLLDRKFAAIPDAVDILLTHTPPRIRHRKVDVSIDRHSPHFGSCELLDAIRTTRPRYALCGHIHSGDHNPILLSHADGNETVVRNVSRLDEEYKVRYEPFVFEV